MTVEIIDNEWDELSRKLTTAIGKIPIAAKDWAVSSANDHRDIYREHLRTQGRPGGEPPPLSPITKELYRQRGEPKGEGIRNHVQVQIEDNSPDSWKAVMGIPQGKVTTIARVQEYGCTIAVTEKMRGWFAHHGIFLSPNTTHINVPGRYSWSKSANKSHENAKLKLAELFQECLKRKD